MSSKKKPRLFTKAWDSYLDSIGLIEARLNKHADNFIYIKTNVFRINIITLKLLSLDGEFAHYFQRRGNKNGRQAVAMNWQQRCNFRRTQFKTMPKS